MSPTEELNKIKEIIEKGKSETAQAEGQLKALTSQLQELGFKSTSSAITDLKDMKEKVTKTEKEIETGVAELRRKI
jgi:septal ring factor EnvC (AmiA/AmiB activator)